MDKRKTAPILGYKTQLQRLVASSSMLTDIDTPNGGINLDVLPSPIRLYPCFFMHFTLFQLSKENKK
jgi:hypothetical protein